MKNYKNFKSVYELAEIACVKGIDCACLKTNTKAEYDCSQNILTITDSNFISKFEPQLPKLIFDKNGNSRMVSFLPFKKKLK